MLTYLFPDQKVAGLVGWRLSSLTVRLVFSLLWAYLLAGLPVSALQAQSARPATTDSSSRQTELRGYAGTYEKLIQQARVPKPASQADSLWQAAIALATYLPDSVGVLTALQAGTYYLAQNEVERAYTYLTRAVEQADRLQLVRYQLQARLMLGKTERRRQTHNSQAVALSLYHWVLRDTVTSVCLTCQLEAMYNLSTLYTASRPDSAQYFLQKSRAVLQRLPQYKETKYYPMVHTQLSTLAFLAGDLTTALREGEEAYRSALQFIPNDPYFLTVAYSYGYLLGDINDAKSLEVTQAAHRVLVQQPNHHQHPMYSQILSNEVALLRILNRRAEAVMLADSILRRHPLTELLTLLNGDQLLNRISQLYIQEKRDEDLKKIVGQVHSLLMSDLSKSRVDGSFLHNMLGRYYVYKQQYTEAVHHMQQQWRLDSLQVGVSQFNYSLMNRIADSQAKAGQRQAAFGSYSRLVAEYDRMIHTDLWLMSDEERDNYLQTTAVTGLYWHLLRSSPQPEEIELAYNFTLLKQGVRLKTSRAINRFTHRRTPQKGENRSMIQQLMAVRLQLADRTLDRQSVTYRQMKQTADSLERHMGNAATLLNQTLKPVHWQDIRTKLKSGEAALELVRYTNYARDETMTDSAAYAVFLIRPEWVAPKMIELPVPDGEGKEYTQAQTRQLRSADYYTKIVFGDANQQKQYQAVWQPIIVALGPVKRLYVALDGSYQGVNLYTIRNPRTGRYLVDELDIVVLNSTQDILDAPRPVASRTAELVGHPTYNLVAAKRAVSISQRTRQIRLRNGIVLEDLPYTQAEVQELGRLLRSFGLHTRERLGKTATEDAFQQMASPRILHVATHGYVQDSTTRETASLLLTCGLALAGAADTVQAAGQTDGILTGYEASLLDLHDTELAVLSACQTGVGAYVEGEGINGLQRAFLLAGAHSVMVSLWSVNDQLTKVLMTDFYRYWLSGMTKPQALRRAQANLRKRYPNPYYWGAFVLIGQ